MTCEYSARAGPSPDIRTNTILLLSREKDFIPSKPGFQVYPEAPD